jgi:D-alanyl-lipoteichoic acid acyltransferase DltB (MBOAT superfamily)
LLDYFIFIAFFPQLIAGPIVFQKEMLPQFRDRIRFAVNGHDIAVGFTLFALGLFKKTVIADNLALLARPVFNAADMGQEISTLSAWTGSFAYTFQLYFDFSGYSDMAIGIARMFGIVLPLNFSSPYKAKSIIDFWKRWHLTLTRFLNTYIFNPIVAHNVRDRSNKGLDISGEAMRRPGAFWSMLAAPILITMTLAGIWHGAGYQFLIFGILHGVYLVANHAWRVYLRYMAGPALKALSGVFLPSFLLTFLCVVVAFVFFRAGTVDSALGILKAGVGLSPVPSSATGLGVLWIVFAMAVSWLLPNSQEWIGTDNVQNRDFGPQPVDHPLFWKPNSIWGYAMISFTFFTITWLNESLEFLYFQF